MSNGQREHSTSPPIANCRAPGAGGRSASCGDRCAHRRRGGGGGGRGGRAAGNSTVSVALQTPMDKKTESEYISQLLLGKSNDEIDWTAARDAYIKKFPEGAKTVRQFRSYCERIKVQNEGTTKIGDLRPKRSSYNSPDKSPISPKYFMSPSEETVSSLKSPKATSVMKSKNSPFCGSKELKTPIKSPAKRKNELDVLTPSKKLAGTLQNLNIGKVSVDIKPMNWKDFPSKTVDFDDSSDESDDKCGFVSASPTPERLRASAKRRIFVKDSALDEAKIRLHTSEVPDKLLKRENECKEIQDFVLNGITKNLSQALYISGVPGTGKTVSVLKIIENLKKTHKNFDFVSVNALELSNPKRLFCVIYKEITKDKKNISAVNSQQKLNDIFSKIDKKRRPLVLLVDEVDMLYTKRQEIVYTIFNWSATEGSRVNVIAISNTLDLPERILAPRVASRLGSKRLCFQPYNHNELAEIITYRISNCPAISKDAVEYAARKVASLSGDLRKALELLRRAIEIAIEECEEKNGDLRSVKLTFAHVNSAIRESTGSIRMDYCNTMSEHEEILFRALVKDLQKSNLEETNYFRLLTEYTDECFTLSVEPLPSSVLFRILMEMACSNFVSLSPDCGQMNRRIALNFPLSEAQFCVRQLDLQKNSPNDIEKVG